MRIRLFWRGAWTATACGVLALAAGCQWCGTSSSGQAAADTGRTPIYDAQSGQPVDYATTSTPAGYTDPYADPYGQPAYTDGTSPYNATAGYTSDPYGQPAYTEPVTSYNQMASYTSDPYGQPAYTEPVASYSAPATYAPAPAQDYYQPAPPPPPPAKPAKAKKGKSRVMSGAELSGIVNGAPPNHVLYVGTAGPYHEVQYSGKGVYEVPAGEVAFRRQFAPGAGTPYLITPYELTSGGVGGYSAPTAYSSPTVYDGAYATPVTYSSPTSETYSSTTISETTTYTPSYSTDVTYSPQPASDPNNQPYIYGEPTLSAGDSSTGVALAATATTPQPSYYGDIVPLTDTY